jgi:hypothetical protein
MKTVQTSYKNQEKQIHCVKRKLTRKVYTLAPRQFIQIPPFGASRIHVYDYVIFWSIL